MSRSYQMLCFVASGSLMALGPIAPPIRLGDTVLCLDWRLLPATQHIPYLPKLTSGVPQSMRTRLPQDVVLIPSWLPASVLAFVGLFVSRRFVRRERMGLCQQCSYDLTGNVSGKCPECGTVIKGQGQVVDGPSLS